ncbi:radical SAM protein [Crassaminicella profunda]|uniref:radical SAM protein n=1 Tax=Crassaminicella profunda TaxID=1286698 RepID=UPI001CA73590|nr:radical SAM protein [Crassaminicella profunda]QZY54872.1 radical SAM protein [Crassaminicella profunda]
MKTYQYLFGPVPSRRMGLSIGVSPIPRKCCNYSCIYCQLGRTNKLTNTRQSFFKTEEILKEFEDYLKEEIKFDVVTIVGEGEPTLYKDLKELILGLKKLTKKPVAVITNGSLLYEKDVREALYEADIVLPSFDGYDEESFKKIDRPFGRIKYRHVYEGLITFSKEYKGQLWIETMIMKEINDHEEALLKIKDLLKNINYNRLYINTPVRPPAEKWVEAASKESIELAVNLLGGISIDMLDSEGFYSEEKDDYKAILSIIKRHPMNQYEIESFLKSRKCEKIEEIFEKLKNDENVEVVDYKGYTTYRYVS